MSVIVKGMDMPTGCLSCTLFAGNGCKATRRLFPDYLNVAVRPDTCPLVTIPSKHGRLIDADALNIYGISPAYGFSVMGVTEEDINQAPTVILPEDTT